jgi:serine/threonine-protein kinase SRPK3
MPNVNIDLQPHNMLLGIKDESILAQYEQYEIESPTPRKFIDDRIIYVSRPLPVTFGPPVVCDFGEARLEDEEHNDDIMPDIYRAPEVILKMNWGYKVDIWNLGVMVSEYHCHCGRQRHVRRRL